MSEIITLTTIAALFAMIVKKNNKNMKQNFNLDPIQQKEDILVWKYGIFAKLESKDLEITKQDEQEFYLTQGYASLPVVTYRSEHPYLDKKIVAIKQIINMSDDKIDKLLETISK